MNYTYRNYGVCSRAVSFDIEDGKLFNVKFAGGCDGNLKAIAKLCEGRDAAEVAELLKGNTCGWKDTSCGDQFSKAIKNALNQVQA